MHLKNDRTKKITIAVLAVSVVCIIAYFLFDFGQKNKVPDTENPGQIEGQTVDDSGTMGGGVAAPGTHSTGQSSETVVVKEIIQEQVINYNEVNDQTEKMPVQEVMQARKEVHGLKKSLDMIVKSNESIIIGEHHVSMRDILEKAFIEKGTVFEEKITTSDQVAPDEIQEYGIYVVQEGDNIWNIHFNILKEYYDFKGVPIEPLADEPKERGLSSGIGKILKFSETMVIIYNLLDKKVDKNINLIQPLSKIVVYNMDEVFSLLQEINYKNVDRIQFDGKNIWIPAKKS
ncbi:MAG: hypothetical protein D3926_05295 [Desulfobacteraceae bacterium]|nr:MAG: hypothetical protein D3926_05295 [Desulfobacteraceae bacterium]